MNKRIRKKHRTGEFQELGFELSFRIPESHDPATADAVIDAFLAEAIAANDLAFFGSGLHAVDGTVIAAARGSVTPAQRDAVEAWLSARDEVEAHTVGQLSDAWHAA
ncbi:MAG: YggL 50S ribosome-binding family protein [Gemmatimonadaceae bacterium]